MVDLIFRKIRSLNLTIKSIEKLSKIFKKNFVQLGLEKKKFLSL